MKNVFVMGLEPFNLELLRTIRDGEAYRFHALFDYAEVVRPANLGYPSLEVLLARAREIFAGFTGSVDGVMGYWDFPTSVVVPMVARQAGLPGPALDAVARCEHKYWSRLEQQKVVPDMVPAFQAIDPFAEDPLGDVELSYPFWIKPVKAHSSFLGFYIDSPETLASRLVEIRRDIGRMGRPFNEFLAHVDLPAEIAPVHGHHCIAEAIVSAGFQCTLEGYSWNGEVTVFGVVDSIRSGRYHSSFTCYQYPSKLPEAVQARMVEATRKLIRHLGYDGAAFNVEYYWNPDDDSIRLLEINSRISKSHSPLFLMVDGATNQKVTLDLALGRKPDFPHRQGEYSLAGKFMVRFFQDGILERVPTDADIRRLQAVYPEARVNRLAPEGIRLRDLKLQDSYSYEAADVFLGASGQKELLDKFANAQKLLDFRVRRLAPPRGAASV
jgi:hypothetical protein